MKRDMKKVVIEGRKKAKITEVQQPQAVGNWALVKIHSAPMCTEYKFYVVGEMPPYPLGHEAAGEVVALDETGPLKVGDRVVVMPQYPCGHCSLCLKGNFIHCEHSHTIKEFTGRPEGDSTFAQHMLKPVWLLPKIPDGMSYDHAAMLCCGLGPTFGAMEKMNVGSSDTILITGMGPVGLGGIINAKLRGARTIATAHNDYRSSLANQLGADLTINPKCENALTVIRDFTDGEGVVKSIECSGTTTAQRLCLEATSRNGSVAFVGESGNLGIHVSDDLIRNGLTIMGIWHYNIEGVSKLFTIAEAAKEKIEKLITHAFPLDRVNEAFDLQLTRQCGKVILHPFDD